MLSVILQFLIAKFESLPYIAKVFGLGSIINIEGEKIIGVYSESELQHVNFDNYTSLVYILTNGNSTRTTAEHPLIATLEKVTEVYPLRAIVYSQGLENVNCNSYSQSLVQGIKKNITGLQYDLVSATNSDMCIIRITDTDNEKSNVWKSQFSSDSRLKDADILCSIDFEVTITGDEQCFAGEPCLAGEFVFSNSATSFCEMVNSCSNFGKPPIFFYTIAGQTTYTASDVSGLANVDTIIAMNMDGSILTPDFHSWDGTTLTISNITISGGEYIVIFYE
jgi:hypothetical protein